MADNEMVTVFRSADDEAEPDAKAIRELLGAQGIESVVLDDSAPGVPSGAWEVQVAAAHAADAEKIIAENAASLPDQELNNPDPSADLDMVTVFRSRSATTSEMEALSIKAMLESSGIAAVIVGDSVLPNLPFEVQVAKQHAEQATKLLEEARRDGPAAADEAESASEAPLNP